MIEFKEKEHKYLRSGVEYLSVTTLIKKYTPKYDTKYWSLYKAVKDVLEKYHEFSNFKWSVGGWENVVDRYRSLGRRAPRFQEVMERQQFYINSWAEAGHVAREMGTKVHKDLEDDVNESFFVKDQDNSILIPNPNAKAYDPLESHTNTVMTEVIVFNDDFKLAGMVDRVDKKGKVVNIIDHKTSKQITKIPFRDAVLKKPVQHLPHANYFEYSLQLSLYAWMLEQFGYKIGKLAVDHRSRETGELIERYPINYLKSEIELILMDYGKR